MKLFNRNIEVSFKGVDINPITKLRVIFDVGKHDGENFNAGVIHIYNLNSSSRGALAKLISSDSSTEPTMQCIIRVGYGDQLIQLLAGDVLYATNQRIGPDWLTEIRIYAGLYNARVATINIDYASKTSAIKVTNDLLAKIKGVDIQFTKEAEDILQNKSIKDGTFSGGAYKEAKLFLSRYGLSFKIEDDGVLFVYVVGKPRESTRNQNEANTFSPDNGLLGTPKITSSGVELRSLLRPQIKILQRIYIDSESINETLQNQNRFTNEYFVTGLKHSGDTHSDEWFTEMIGAYVGIDK